MAPALSVSKRTRRTPWTDQVTAAGVKAYTVYNHMLLPTVFNSLQEDYHHLSNHVQVWDVACERQVQLKGPDAFKLLQLMTPRDMEKMREGQCFYIPIVDQAGTLLNDPVALKVDMDTYWVSVASSDIILYAKGLVIGYGMDVEVSEPDINPLGIQGPKADELMARVFGDMVHEVRFFRFKWLEFQGVLLAVARSGYSGRGGYEIYVPGPALNGGQYPRLATDLWDTLFAEGEDLQVGPGGPNLIDIIEAGLLSFGTTIGYEHSPYEAALGKYCNGLDTCLGGEALMHEAENGPARIVKGIKFGAQDFKLFLDHDWPILDENRTQVGYLSAVVGSVELGVPIGIGTVNKSHWDAGTSVTVQTPDGPRAATVSDLPFRKS